MASTAVPRTAITATTPTTLSGCEEAAWYGLPPVDWGQQETPQSSPPSAACTRPAPVSSYDFGLEYLEQLGFVEPRAAFVRGAPSPPRTATSGPSWNQESSDACAHSASPKSPRSRRMSRVAPGRASRSRSLECRRLPLAVAVEVRRPLSPRSYQHRLALDESGAHRRRAGPVHMCCGSPPPEPRVRDKKHRPPRSSGRGRDNRSTHTWQHAEQGRMTMTCSFSEESSAQASWPHQNSTSTSPPSSWQSQVYLLYS